MQTKKQNANKKAQRKQKSTRQKKQKASKKAQRKQKSTMQQKSSTQTHLEYIQNTVAHYFWEYYLKS